MIMSETSKFFVNQRGQFSESGGLPVTPISQEPGDVLRGG